ELSPYYEGFMSKKARQSRFTKLRRTVPCIAKTAARERIARVCRSFRPSPTFPRRPTFQGRSERAPRRVEPSSWLLELCPLEFGVYPLEAPEPCSWNTEFQPRNLKPAHSRPRVSPS